MMRSLDTDGQTDRKILIIFAFSIDNRKLLKMFVKMSSMYKIIPAIVFYYVSKPVVKYDKINSPIPNEEK